jgi:hypothetical protein
MFPGKWKVERRIKSSLGGVGFFFPRVWDAVSKK